MSKHVNEEKAQKKKRLYLAALILLLLLLISSCSITIWSVFFRDTTPVLAPDYAPEEIEPEAEKTDDDTSNKLEASEGGGAVSVQYTKECTFDISDKRFDLYFKNPGESDHDMILQVMVQDTVIAQSGRLPAGYELKHLQSFGGASLSPGGYNGRFVVLFYNQESGEKAVVKSEIPLTIKVVE